MRMELAYEEYKEWDWEKPSDQQLYQEWLNDAARLNDLALIYSKTINKSLGLKPGSSAILNSDMWSEIELVQIGFHRNFNPDYSDQRVQDYLFNTIYAPGSTMHKPVLLDPSKLEYQFPFDLPTPIEKRLELLVANETKQYPKATIAKKITEANEKNMVPKFCEIFCYMGMHR